MVLALHSLQPAPSKCNVLSSTHRASRVRAKVTAPGRRGGRSTVAAPSAVLDSLCSTVLQSSANTTAAVLATSFVFYTAWDGKGQFTPSAVTDTLTLKKGVANTLVTLNKAVSVAALALLGLAFFPQLASSSSELLRNALGMLGAHAAFSVVKFYGTPIIPKIQTWTSADRQAAIKIGALCLGGFAQNLLAAGYLQFVSRIAIVFGTLTLSTAHFLGERHGTGMPPAGYAAIAVAAWAVVSVLTGNTVVA